MSDIASDCVVNEKLMPCLASFFDAISGVKKLNTFTPAINCPTSANEPVPTACFVAMRGPHAGMKGDMPKYGNRLQHELPSAF